MFFGGEFFLMFVLLFGIGPTQGNDFLDMVPTASYWQAKKIAPTPEQLQQDAQPEKAPANVDKLIKDLASEDFKTRDQAQKQLDAMGPAVVPLLKPVVDSKDPEVAAVASNLVKKFSERGQERNVRRLMAIRTLGERKDKTALPLLKSMADSKDLFVSDYAARAVANIEGNKITRPDPHKPLLADLQLLPKDTDIVIQATGLPGESLVLDKILDQALDPANQNPMMGMGPLPAKLDKKKILAKLTGHFLDALERVGNVRIDGATVALSLAKEGHWTVVALRGKYDPAAFLAVAKAQGGDSLKLSRNGKIDVAEFGSEMTVLLPNTDQMIFINGDDEIMQAAAKKVLAVLNGGKSDFAENKELAALLKDLDTTGPAWGAARFNEQMHGEKAFEAFDTVAFTTKNEKDAITFTFTAQGKDADKMKESAEALNTAVQGMIAQIKPMAAQMKPLQSVLEVLDSIKITPKGTTGTLAGQLKPSIIQSMIATYAPIILMTSGDDLLEGQDQDNAAPNPAPAPEAVEIK